jgi:hypothetical protein
VGGLVPPLHCHQRRGNRTTAYQVSTSAVYQTLCSLVYQSVTWVASYLLSTAVRGGGTVLQQIRSVLHRFTFIVLCSHCSSSLSCEHGLVPPLYHQRRGELYYRRSGQYITCLVYSLLIGLAVCHVGGLEPPLYRHQRRGNCTTADQVSTTAVYHTLFSLV